MLAAKLDDDFVKRFDIGVADELDVLKKAQNIRLVFDEAG